MKYSWEQFRIALGFLTILPVAPSVQVTPERLGRSMALFPAAGLLLGLLLVCTLLRAVRGWTAGSSPRKAPEADVAS